VFPEVEVEVDGIDVKAMEEFEKKKKDNMTMRIDLWEGRCIWLMNGFG